jgi:hypothetical protein
LRASIVDELDHLALADLLADVDDQLAHRLEERAGALEVLRRPAGHDRQRAVLGLRARAGHRRVDERNAALRELAGDAAAVAGGDRRHVHAQRAIRGAFGDAVVAEQDLLDLRAVDHHRDDDVAGPADLGGGPRDGAAVLGRPRLGPLASAVVDGQLVPRATQIGRHARAHDPQPDEPDALHGAGS